MVVSFFSNSLFDRGGLLEGLVQGQATGSESRIIPYTTSSSGSEGEDTSVSSLIYRLPSPSLDLLKTNLHTDRLGASDTIKSLVDYLGKMMSIENERPQITPAIQQLQGFLQDFFRPDLQAIALNQIQGFGDHFKADVKDKLAGLISAPRECRYRISQPETV